MTLSPMRVVGLQVVASVLLAGFWAAFRGGNSAMSALIGGAICFIPGGLFALRLGRASARQDGYVFAFFVGEGIKVLLSMALFGLAGFAYREADWLALMVSFIVVLQVYVVGLAFPDKK